MKSDENALRGVFLYPFQEITRLPAGLFIAVDSALKPNDSMEKLYMTTVVN